MNLSIWDIESSSASTDFGSIIEIGGILFDENFKEKDRFNLRCRLHETEIFQAEDGIRDHRESRGLGDVYKRQIRTKPFASKQVASS